jgi:hypothetical protein
MWFLFLMALFFWAIYKIIYYFFVVVFYACYFTFLFFKNCYLAVRDIKRGVKNRNKDPRPIPPRVTSPKENLNFH